MKSYSLKLKKQISEVFIIKPNDLGSQFLTYWFKKSTLFLKQFPFLYLIPLATLIAFLVYLFLGKKIVFITTFLQYGF